MTKKKRKSKFKKTFKSGSRTKEPCGYEDVEIVPLTGKKYNKMHKTCIHTKVDNDLYYLTTRHFFRQNIDSIMIQKYDVMASDTNKVNSCKIMIENRYIGCFVRVVKDWYAIMRMLPVLAYLAKTEKLRTFFKFKPGSIKIYSNGLIHFPHQIVEPNAKIIKIKDEDVENITIDETAVDRKFFGYTYDNHPANKKQPTDEIFKILDIFRLDFRHNYI